MPIQGMSPSFEHGPMATTLKRSRSSRNTKSRSGAPHDEENRHARESGRLMECTLKYISDGLGKVPKPAYAENVLIGILGIYEGIL